MKDVLITRPMPTNTHTRNHRWEVLGGSDNVLSAALLRLRFRGLSDASRAPSLGAGRYLEFATRDSPSANRTMSPSYVRWLAIAGIIIGTVGVFFFGVLAILIAIVLFGLSILGLAATVIGPTPTPRRGWGFTCSACGGELLGREPVCPRCGRESSTRTRRASRPPTAETCSCRVGNSRRKWARPAF